MVFGRFCTIANLIFGHDGTRPLGALMAVQRWARDRVLPSTSGKVVVHKNMPPCSGAVGQGQGAARWPGVVVRKSVFPGQLWHTPKSSSP